MNKRGDITEATPDTEERLRDKRAADDPTSKICALDDDVNKRLAEKAAASLEVAANAAVVREMAKVQSGMGVALSRLTELDSLDR